MANLVGIACDGPSAKLTKSVKRKYDKYVICKNENCYYSHIVSDKTIGYLCPKCGKYNNAEEANIRFQDSLLYPEKYPSPEFIGLGKTPHIKTEAMDNYVKFRDEHAIRADLYVKGITRNTVGSATFRQILKKQLKENHCYRGKDSNVD